MKLTRAMVSHVERGNSPRGEATAAKGALGESEGVFTSVLSMERGEWMGLMV